MTRKAIAWISYDSSWVLSFFWAMYNSDGTLYGAFGENYPLSVEYSDNQCSIREQIVDYLQTSVDPDGTCKVTFIS